VAFLAQFALEPILWAFGLHTMPGGGAIDALRYR
jgi:hypothetical protein